MFVVDRILRRTIGEERRYTTLMWSLIILLMLYPIMGTLGLSRFWSLFFVAELLLAVYSVSEGTRSLKIATWLVAPAVVGELAFFFLETKETHWFAVLSVGAFLGYVVSVVYKQSVFSKGRMTTDRVAGAISVYLLLGLLWALAYGVISAADPEAFKGLQSFSMEESGVQQDFVYFSFVTLTTLGYGDMSPVSGFAKSLAWLEAVFGQLYLAVTIARLVSLELAHETHPPADN
jgi:voltage-gated potassium channel